MLNRNAVLFIIIVFKLGNSDGIYIGINNRVVIGSFFGTKNMVIYSSDIDTIGLSTECQTPIF